jgi:hypothetical protein
MPKKINIMDNAGVMTDRLFREIWQQAIDAPDEDAFISAVNCPDKDLLTVQDQLSRLWHVANDDFRTLLDAFNMTQTIISTRFCIPFSSVQNWACEMRVCPPYLRLMMAEALGYITLRDMQ